MENKLKPLKPWEYLTYFGIPALLMVISVYWILPALISFGVSEYLGLQIASLVPYITLLIASLVAFHLEKNQWSWSTFKNRFRLQKMSIHDYLIGFSLTVISLVVYLGWRQLVMNLAENKIILLPAFLPRIIDPRQQVSFEELTNGSIVGNWSLVMICFVVWFFNIFGEELWWRGYLLPRQEAGTGGNAWIAHGFLWTLFHVFKYWELIAILPVSLVLSYVVQTRKNTWIGILVHGAVNSLGVISILLLVLGRAMK